MLIIRKEQKEILGQRAARAFEDRLMGHLRRHFPQRCEALGQDGLGQVVCAGRERAESLGFTGQREVCKYVSLVVCFGLDLDTAQPWARRILHGPPWSESTTRMDRLMEAAAGCLEHQQGGTNRG